MDAYELCRRGFRASNYVQWPQEAQSKCVEILEQARQGKMPYSQAVDELVKLRIDPSVASKMVRRVLR